MIYKGMIPLTVLVTILFTINAVTAASVGSWTVRTETSPIDDSTSIYATVESAEPIWSPRGINYHAMLTASCVEGQVQVALYYWDHIFVDGSISIRVDDEPAENFRMLPNLQGTTIGLSGSEAIAFLDGISHGENLFVRTESVMRQIDVEFALEGVGEAVATVLGHCGD